MREAVPLIDIKGNDISPYDSSSQTLRKKWYKEKELDGCAVCSQCCEVYIHDSRGNNL